MMLGTIGGDAWKQSTCKSVNVGVVVKGRGDTLLGRFRSVSSPFVCVFPETAASFVPRTSPHFVGLGNVSAFFSFFFFF